MKLLRILLSIILLLIVVSIFAIACLVYFFDPNKLKPVIAAEVQRQTNYELTIDSKLSWTLYPTLGISIPHMTLRAPQQTAAFIDLSDVTIATDFKQLLKGTEKLEGDVHIKELKLMNLHAESARIGIKWQDQILTLSPLTTNLYKGSLEGIVHGKNFSSQPNWDWNVQMKQVQLKPLLEDVNGVDSKIKIDGLGDLNFQATATGKAKDTILNSTDGTLTFSLNNGAVDGVDINYMIQTADAIISKQPIAPPANNQTAFSSLTGSMLIKNGVAQTDNLLLTSSSFTTKGQGQFNLMNQTMNLTLQVSPLNTTKIKGTLPILITGDIHSPSIKLDTAALDTDMVKDQLEKAKSKVQEKADKFLQKILGQ